MDAVSSRCYPPMGIIIDILSSSPFLPEDLTIEILLRLPVKSLLRFTTVCRQWHTIITSSGFIRTHVHQGSNFTSGLVHWGRYAYGPESQFRLGPAVYESTSDDVNSCSIFPDGTLERYDVPHLIGPIYSMWGPCNGIICVTNGDYTVALWNPATRRLRQLPLCPYFQFNRRFEIGLGADPITEDLKIVLFDIWDIQRKFVIYNSKNDSWELFEDDALFFNHEYSIALNNGRTFSNGFCYWQKICRSSNKTGILAFDMRNNVFQHMEMPEDFEPGYPATLDLLDGTLALLTRHNIVDSRRVEIWLMKERGCWTKHATVFLPFDCYAPFGIWKRNQIYLRTTEHGLMIHDLDSGNTKKLEHRKIDASTCRFLVFLCQYKESLISV